MGCQRRPSPSRAPCAGMREPCWDVSLPKLHGACAAPGVLARSQSCVPQAQGRAEPGVSQSPRSALRSPCLLPRGTQLPVGKAGAGAVPRVAHAVPAPALRSPPAHRASWGCSPDLPAGRLPPAQHWHGHFLDPHPGEGL